MVRIVDVGRGLTAESRSTRISLRMRPGGKSTRKRSPRASPATSPGSLHGADIALASDLPRASGLSSSSALIVSLFTALSGVNALERHPAYGANIAGPDDIAAYLGGVENGRPFRSLEGDRGVGTLGGSEDHVAILCGHAGQIVQYAFDPVDRERVIRLEDDWSSVHPPPGTARGLSGRAGGRGAAGHCRGGRSGRRAGAPRPEIAVHPDGGRRDNARDRRRRQRGDAGRGGACRRAHRRPRVLREGGRRDRSRGAGARGDLVLSGRRASRCCRHPSRRAPPASRRERIGRRSRFW